MVTLPVSSNHIVQHYMTVVPTCKLDDILKLDFMVLLKLLTHGKLEGKSYRTLIQEKVVAQTKFLLYPASC